MEVYPFLPHEPPLLVVHILTSDIDGHHSDIGIDVAAFSNFIGATSSTFNLWFAQRMFLEVQDQRAPVAGLSP